MSDCGSAIRLLYGARLDEGMLRDCRTRQPTALGERVYGAMLRDASGGLKYQGVMLHLAYTDFTDDPDGEAFIDYVVCSGTSFNDWARFVSAADNDRTAAVAALLDGAPATYGYCLVNEVFESDEEE